MLAYMDVPRGMEGPARAFLAFGRTFAGAPRAALQCETGSEMQRVEECELAVERSWKQAEASTPTSVSSRAQAAAGESHTSGTAQAPKP